MAALNASTTNFIHSSSIISLLSSTQRRPPTTTLCFKSKQRTSRIRIFPKHLLASKIHTPNCKYGNDDTSSPRTLDEKSNTRTKSSTNNPVPLKLEPNAAHRIWWSNLEVKKPNNVFLERRWSSLNIGTLSVVVLVHGLALFAPVAFNWGAFWVAVVLYFVTGMLGMSLSYHRNLSHKSFKLPKWLEYTLAYCGVLALQGDPIQWVSTHKYHHQYTDTEQDPHSPIKGFWFSHIIWMFDSNNCDKFAEPYSVEDLEKQHFYRFIRSTYILHPLLLGVLLYAIGGFPYLVWGMGVRTIWMYHIIWFANSVCHIWGNQVWNTGDLSKNNWWVALLSFGEGWHNNHHAFEYAARHGLEWWQVDMTWYIVKLLHYVGLAKEVKLPTEAHKQRYLKVNG